MPNTLTNVQDIKVAQRALQALTPVRAFSSNFSPDPAEKLDTVRAPIVGTPAQSSDFAGGYHASISRASRWAEAKTISDLTWPAAEKQPMEALRAETLKRHPELAPKADAR